MAPLLAIRSAIHAANQPSFRIIHFSVQSDHVHLIVEAHDKLTLEWGIRGLIIRMARGINRALIRTGPVWGDRYHTHELQTPREVHHAIRYVLLNHKKHGWADQPLDDCSSAPWFNGFKEPLPRTLDPPVIRAPQTWLARKGWKVHGLISLDDAPLPYPPPR
jgi:REP element-mobilizing transposase RayT